MLYNDCCLFSCIFLHMRIMQVREMDINIASIKNYEGKSIPIDCMIGIEGRPGDDFRLLGPVKVYGVIRNFGGTIEFEAEGLAKLCMVCDRCAEEYEQTVGFDIAESFKETDKFESGDDEDSSEIIPFSGDTIDLDDYVYSALVVSLPTKHLCRDDCKGLCPLCGANLNDGPCGCDATDTDPRFDILDSIEVE